MSDFRARSVGREFIVAAIALTVAVATGLNGVGEPLRRVQVLTMVALGMAAGVALGRAFTLLRARATDSSEGV